MRKFEKQATPDHVYVIAIDTICTGWDSGSNGDGDIPLYTKEEAEEELQELLELEIESAREYFEDFDEEYAEGGFSEEDVESPYFMVHMNEYIEGRKFLVGAVEGKLVSQIIGDKPLKQES